ncbi:MarR family winged helix-turn-helix transcriptional regulator [Microbacterium trichothecenolyticum]|uniref:MarR family winged helix-turn-helix transcriptional regulator n=1 Tax=Microbacterium trichothecenolyticum TaxID=69370 RepID=UPI0027D8FBD6|nr:MarR family transcriptional regulator [Microbacterium trichothecenolyticum]
MTDTLRAVQTLSDALDRMHSGMKGDMDMNASDLATLRMLTIREHRGQIVSPHDVASHLRISTASTTKLIDRLVATGHLERRPHPSDGRARVVVLTDKSRREFFRHFGVHLAAMSAVAATYGDAELATINGFLEALTEAITTAP